MGYFSPHNGFRGQLTCPNFRQRIEKKGFLGKDSYYVFNCSCNNKQLDVKYVEAVCSEQKECKNCSNYKKYGICN